MKKKRFFPGNKWSGIKKLLLVMKLTTLFLFFSVMAMAARSYSQNARFDLNVKNATIIQVFDEIEQVTDFGFLFKTDQLDLNKRYTLDIKNTNVEKIMNEVLDKDLYSYNIIERTIVITKTGENASQNRTSEKITGKVTDSSGAPLPGVTIVVKGTTNGTITDKDGIYSLFNIPNGSIIQFSFIGMKSQEIQVSERSRIDIVMSEDVVGVDEVVVIGFGLTQKKETLSGAISSVGAEELAHSSSATASGALVGKMAGVNFRQTNGKPGSAPTLQIRNYGDPFVIIDGVQRDYESLSQLDFNDIENVSVLKDASASIYGMQASNGVIVVTTKKGKRNQKPKISLHSYYGVQNPDGYNVPADAKTYLKAIIQDETYNNVPDASRTITKEEYDKWVNGSDKDHKSFDWYNYIWKPAPQYYNNVSLSGGAQNMNYYISIGNFKQEGLLRNFNGFERTNFQSNIDVDVTKRLKVGMSITGRLEEQDQPGLPGDDYDFAVNAAFRNLPTKRPFANDNPKYPAISSIDPQYSYGWIDYDTSGKYFSKDKVIQLTGTVEYNILNGLKARGLFGYYFKNNHSSTREKAPILYSYDENSEQYNIAYQGSGRYLERNFQNSEEVTTNFQLDYHHVFGKHNVHFVTGAEHKTGEYPRVYIWGSPAADGIKTLNMSSVNAVTDDISYKQKRLGFIGRLNYDYDRKYIMEFSCRYDGSYFYKQGKRYGFFPSGSAGYHISRENFWQNNNFLNSLINDLKIRGSYGITGKEVGDALTYITGYNYNYGAAILDGKEVITSRVSGLATDNITWGRVYLLNIGADINMFKNRLTGSFEWFQRHEKGDLASRSDVYLPNEVGFSLPSENLNGDYTRGTEFSLNWHDKIKDFEYWAGGNFTFSRWVTGERYKPHWSSAYDRYRDLYNTDGRYRDGSFQLVAIGQFKSWEEIANYPIDQDHYGNTTIRPGDYIYKDVNHDGYINDLDMKNVTYRVNGGTPWINFAFNIGGRWKGFDLRADFAGGSCYTYEQQSYMRYFDGNANVSKYLAENSTWYNDIWDKTSGFKIGKYPLLTKGVNNWMNTQWPNSKWQTNVTYVKLRNLEFGYTLPEMLTSKVNISNVRIYVSGQNILTFTNMPGNLDPEITSNSGMSYPNPKVYNIGLKVEF